MQVNKLLYGLAAIWLAAILFSCAPEQDKSKEQQSSKEEQKEQKEEQKQQQQEQEQTPEEQTYTQPRVLPYYEESDEVLKDRFLPIGWSKKGNFAYITGYADEACGCYRMQITIVGPQAKDTLWTWDFESMDYKKTLPDVWSEQKATFKQKLNAHGILQQEGFEVHDTRFAVKNQTYQVQLETETETDPYFGFDVIKEGRILLKTPSGKKHVHTFTEPSPSLVLGAMVYGVLKSPYEERIMVIYKRERRGYEGPPHVLTFRLAGAAL